MQRLLPAGVYYGWAIVFAAFAINVVVSPLNPLVFSFFIGPMSDELGVGRSALAWCFTLRLVAGGLAGPWLGVFIDRYGARWLGAACGALAGGMLIALSFAHELWLIYALFAVSGVAGFGGPAGQLLTTVPIAKWFVAKRGRALAVATTGLGAGTAIAIPASQWLIETIGWREAYLIFGFVIVGAVVPLSVLLVRRSPEDLGLHPDGAASAEAVAAHAEHGSIATTEDWTVGEAMRTRAMWLLLAAIGIAGVALTGTVVHRTSYWEDVGMSPALVGIGTAIDPLTVIGAMFAFGVAGDRLPIRYLGCLGLALFAVSMVPVIVTDGEAYTIVLHALIWGLAAGGYITLNNLVWPNYFGRRYLGAIRGVVLPVSIAASGLGAPLIGLLLDVGLDARIVWAGALSAFVAGAALVLLARPPRLPAVRPEAETVGSLVSR